jgi:hypothetical protein
MTIDCVYFMWYCTYQVGLRVSPIAGRSCSFLLEFSFFFGAANFDIVVYQRTYLQFAPRENPITHLESTLRKVSQKHDSNSF